MSTYIGMVDKDLGGLKVSRLVPDWCHGLTYTRIFEFQRSRLGLVCLSPLDVEYSTTIISSSVTSHREGTRGLA